MIYSGNVFASEIVNDPIVVNYVKISNNLRQNIQGSDTNKRVFI
jgi:hypothetical protein